MTTRPVLFTFMLLPLIAILSSCRDTANEHCAEPDAAGYFSPTDSSIQTGGIQIIPIQTSKGTFNVWTKRIGNNPTAKVLLLNGGPGLSHEYLECFESFFPQGSIEFIYYDQLGCGHSDNPDDTSLWDLQRYTDEVEAVRIALKLDSSNFFLFGHSWGGILALEYALKYQSNLKGLIISNMMASAPDYGRYADEILGPLMPPDVLDTIRSIEASGNFSDPRYMELLMPHYYAEHICRIPVDQWPEPVTRSFEGINQSLYVTMQGPSEFGIAGKLLNWDRSKDLGKIKVPTLTIGAKHDTMDPEHMKWMAGQMPNGRHLYCANGSHMSFYDDQKVYMKGLMEFIEKTVREEK